MFLSGPTCGVCLRGMADLNDAFIADSQDDDRLVTFVVHVPTMGAKEQHAVDSIPLLDGPRVHHYWEESGIIGQHYKEVMSVDMYVWDFWAIYGSDAIWDGPLPPKPAYYEHQLGVSSGKFRTFAKELVLDAERFAAETRKYLATVDGDFRAANDASERSDGERLGDGTVIPHVGQPRSLVVRQHIMGRGGYKNLKRIQSVTARGHFETSGVSSAMTIESERPNVLRRRVDSAASGLPADLERRLQNSFEFDGLLVEWPDKGHTATLAGMQKIGDVLAWQIGLEQASGTGWKLFLDSHTGDLVRAVLLDNEGQAMYVIAQSDFHETAGFRFPHRIEYMYAEGKPLAVETIDEIEVDVLPFEIEQESVTH